MDSHIEAQYLKAGYYINSDHPEVIAFTKKHISSENSLTENINSIYIAVRDGFLYNPFEINLSKEGLKASYLLSKDNGYCGEKACLLAACMRVINVPSRLGFSQVTNHLGTSKLEEILETNTLVFHGYTEIYLDGKWIKLTPAFNKSLCDKLGVPPLEFNPKGDSIFQAHENGKDFMEYLHEYGSFEDYPRDLFLSELEKNYPNIFKKLYEEEKKNKLHIKLL